MIDFFIDVWPQLLALSTLVIIALLAYRAINAAPELAICAECSDIVPKNEIEANGRCRWCNAKNNKYGQLATN